MLHFDLNISMLLKEYSFLDRFDQAAKLGFDAVEFWWPTDEDFNAIIQRVRDTGLQVALFNFDAGDMPNGDRGLLNDPERQAQFRANVPVAIELAQQIGCTKINALVGRWSSEESRDAQLQRVQENLHWATEQAHAAGITVVVEAINTWENGPYMFTNTLETLTFLEQVGAPNLAFQYDVYHMYRMEGNVVANIREYGARFGHIQIADSPDRHHPGTGELNYPFILQSIIDSGYTGMIGLEYKPSDSIDETFAWLPEDRRGKLAVESLRL